MRKTAREAGMTLQHYSNIENGKRGDRVSFMITTRISKALGISLDFMAEQETKYQHDIQNEDY
jgi:transcriptional regulator with XRE-family HTH domain